jgi:hypothetical protein
VQQAVIAGVFITVVTSAVIMSMPCSEWSQRNSPVGSKNTGMSNVDVIAVHWHMFGQRLPWQRCQSKVCATCLETLRLNASEHHAKQHLQARGSADTATPTSASELFIKQQFGYYRGIRSLAGLFRSGRSGTSTYECAADEEQQAQDL